MRRLVNWALGGENSSSSSESDASGSECDLAEPRDEQRRGPYLSEQRRAATPPPSYPANIFADTEPLLRSPHHLSVALPSVRPTHDAVREYLDGVAAAPPEVEVKAGAYEWLYGNVGERETEAMAWRAQSTSKSDPDVVNDAEHKLAHEVSMEAHFQSRLDDLAREYRLPTRQLGGAERDGRDDLETFTLRELNADNYQWLMRKTRGNNTEWAAEHSGITDSRSVTPSAQTVSPASADESKKTSGSALLWLVKAVFTRSSPKQKPSDVSPIAKDRAATPPPFELSYDPEAPTRTSRGLALEQLPPKLRTSPSFLTAVETAPVSPPPPPVVTTRAANCTDTTPPVLALETPAVTPPHQPFSPIASALLPVSEEPAVTTTTATVTYEGEETVLEKLERLAEVDLPDVMPHKEESVSMQSESALRSRFNSLFASNSAELVPHDTPPAEQQTPFVTVTVTSDEPDVARQIERLSERYLTLL